MRMLGPFVAVMVALATGQAGFAGEVSVQTPAPVIHLKDNLDEADGLGWCIDTVGRGFAEFLHAHSCKPRGGDVQFAFEPGNALIRSVAFSGKCVVALAEGAPTDFGLADCDAGSPSQRFGYSPSTLSLHDAQDPTRCMAVGKVSRPGPSYPGTWCGPTATRRTRICAVGSYGTDGLANS